VSKARIASIDAMRFYGFLAILLLHIVYRPSDGITTLALTDHLLRWAVPVYFVISGFLFDSRSKPVPEKWRQTAWRLASIFLFWEIVYLALEHLFLSSTRAPTTRLRFLADTVLNGGVAWHLWFLPSLGLCVTVYCILQRLGRRAVIGLGCAVFLISVALGPYAFLFGLPTLPTRPLFGLIFFIVGAVLAHRPEALSRISAAALLVVGVALQMSEALVLSLVFGQRFAPYDMLLGTLPFGIGAFVLLKGMPVFQPAASLGRTAVGMYCVHVLWLWFAGGVLKIPAGDAADILDITLTFVFVAVASAATTLLLVRVPLLRRVVS
jgi:surface polysaccharide O-acyltransferase-like enzyme